MTDPVARWMWTAAAFLFFGGLALPGLLEEWRGRTRSEWKEFTPTIRPELAAEWIAQGRPVVFVDVREAAEHEEFHIPGSVHIHLPDLHHADLTRFEGADAVVPYCLKDFRGWEGGKILIERGVKNVMILEGYGTNSWEKERLPMAGRFPGKTDAEALAEIRGRFCGGVK